MRKPFFHACKRRFLDLSVMPGTAQGDASGLAPLVARGGHRAGDISPLLKSKDMDKGFWDVWRAGAARTGNTEVFKLLRVTHM